MNVFVNNNEVATEVATVLALADELGLPTRGVAVAINNRVIHHEVWAETMLHEGDHLTIIKAAYGG